jgi:hypothetical protein
MFCAFGFSQNSPITFESGGYGSSWTFSSFENSTGIGYEKAANPFVTGINTSATVGKYTAVIAGQPWAGCETAHASGANGIGTFTFSLSNCIVKVMVYKSVISDVGLKFAEANGEAQPEVKVANTKINEWEELTFDMSGSIGKGATGIIDQMIIFPDFQARSTENVCYFDNITFSAKTTPTVSGPTTAAPTPAARPATDVISIFSGAYADLVGTNWNPNWGQSTVYSEVVIAGNATKKYTNFNYQGIDLASPIDVTGMTKLHLDVWSPDCTALKVFLVTSTGEQAVTVNPTVSGWNSIDINLSDYTVNKASVSQFKLESVTAGTTVYFDNLYFSKGIVAPPVVTGPTLPLDFEAASYTFIDFDGGAATKIANPQMNGINTSANVAQMVKGAGAMWAGSKIVLTSPVDFSTKKLFKVKVWSPVAGKKLLLKFEQTGGAGGFEKESTGVTAANTWEELSFDFTGVAGVTNLADNMVFIFDLGTPGDGSANSTYLFDDITQSVASGGTVTPPATGLNAPVTFETSEQGSTWTFTNFENGTNPLVGYEKVANPSVAGINTSATVGKFTTAVAGATWAGCQSNGIGKFTLDPTNSTVKIMVYKTVISDVALKFAIAGGGSLGEIKVPNTKVNEWEELTFDFYNQIGKLESTDIVTMMVSPDYRVRTTDNVSYFDNITFSKTLVAPPVLVCDAVLTEAQQGTFDIGYKTSFVTTGTDVLVTFELLDAKDGTVAYLWKESPFGETAMTNVPGTKKFTYNLTGQTAGNIITYACKFGYAGGQAVTKYIKYEVGSTCSGVTPPPVVGAGVTLPLDFESSSYAFVDFDGGVATKIANPHSTGINTSANVAQMVKGAGQPWGGSKIKMASPVDFSTKKLFKVKVWSPVAGKKLLLKFEKSDGTGGFEKESTGVTAANTWEELSFDFTGVAGVTNLDDNMVLIFDLGTMGDGSANSTYLFDDVSQSVVSGGSTKTQMSLPVTFDDATVDYGLIGFGGADVSTVVVDPTLASNNVAKVVKSVTAELWAGTTISAAAGLGFSGVIPFTASATKMSVRVWSPNAGIKVRLKLEEHGDNTHTVETETAVTTASGWETLEFNFATPATGTAALNLSYKYDKASIFFNFGTTGATAGEKIYYFDDVKFVTSSVATGATLPLDFESPSYTFVDFDGGVASKIANPHITGINTSANVAQMVKGAGQPWAGSKIKMASPVDFSTKKLFKVKVWSPVAGKKLLLKFEKSDGTGGFEKESTGVTSANVWEELSFDFTGVSGVSNLADNMVFIFDLGTAGDGSANSTYLFDEITQSTTVGGGNTLTQMKLPVSFDDATVDYGLIGFGGADASSVVVDPTSSANKVAKVVKSATAELWAGTTISAAAGLGFSSAIPFTATATKMSVRIWSPDAGTIVRLKVEEHVDNTHTIETETAVTTAKGWETVVFDFAKPVSGTSPLNLAYTYDKATVFFGFGTTGVQQAAEKIYYFDDVMMKADLTKPVLSYGVTAETYPLGKSIYPLTMVNTGGQVPANGFSISPVLPAGLSFDATTATISGSPSVMSLATTYTITGVNEAGSGSTTISIAVVRDLKSNNFTIETTGETCLGEKNGEINIKALESHTYVAIINDKSYEFTTNSLRVFNLAPGVYTISISVKGESYLQSFTAVVPKGSTITGKTSKSSYNKLTVVMTEGTAPYKVYLDGEVQFETPFSTFTIDVNKESLLEVKTAKLCEGTYSKNVEGILDASAAFPNPTSGSFEIAIPTNRKEVVIDLYSLTSMFISSKSYPLENGTVKLSLEGQTDGVYIAKVYLDTPSYLKIIKK